MISHGDLIIGRVRKTEIVRTLNKLRQKLRPKKTQIDFLAMDSEIQSVRIDKWLWAVRLYKSRSMATEACANGKVQVNEQIAKASRTLKIGDVISAPVGEIQRTIKVIALLDKRVGAKLVSQFFEELTPASELSKTREKNLQPFAFRPKGSGRPTKKDRRNIKKILDEFQ